MPRRPARHVDIGAKAQRMDGSVDRVCDRGDRGEVDDRDHLARNVGEAEAGRLQHFWRTPQLVGAEDREESFDHGAACRRAQVAARDLTALHLDGERVA